MGFLEDDVLQQGDGIDILLLHRAVLFLLLTDHDTGRLWLEEHTTGGDGGGRAVLELRHADRAEADLEDTYTVELDLLSQFEEVLERLTEFLEHGLDVGLLHGGLTLDEVSEFLGTDEMIVIHGLGKVLPIGFAVTVLVLGFDKFLCHKLVIKGLNMRFAKERILTNCPDSFFASFRSSLYPVRDHLNGLFRSS